MSTLKLPAQINEISLERAACAPYNFVPLPAQIVPAEQVPEDWQVHLPQRDQQEDIVYPRALRQDAYYSEQAGRYNGSISCTLTTESPLFVRCALTLAEFKQSEEQKKKAEEDRSPETRRGVEELAKNTPAFFYTHSREVPVIPGSSLRGMLRALVEIASYSKMAKISPTGGYFFRAVAAKGDDPLARPYRDLLKNVRAGYLVREGQGWAIQPARTLNGETFIKVRERDIPPALNLTRMSDLKNYHPQYKEISFTTRVTPNGRTVVDQIDHPGIHRERGWLVTSGNMIETGKEGAARTPRKNHCVVLPPIENAMVPIEQQAIKDYRAGLTEFQRDTPFGNQSGVFGVLLPENHPVPVFYCEPARGQTVIFFGHSPNFRIPYRSRGDDHALAPADFVPRSLRDTALPDLTEAIFGFVRDDAKAQDTEQPPEREQMRAGRVFVGDATFNDGQGTPWLDATGAAIIPHILGSPKPTTFQHYLVQPSSQKRDLKHYASAFGSPDAPETVIRGHKLYWHKGAVGRAEIEDTDFLKEAEKEQKKDTQHTQFRPVQAGMQFTFNVHFENLSQVELGALLWVLDLAADEQYRLSLGMGKPLGMGAIKITHTVSLTDRVRRYQQLFTESNWETGSAGAMSPEIETACMTAFETHVLTHSGERAAALRETLRIRCLLALLTWQGPPKEQTRYMEIERKIENEKSHIPAAKPVRAYDPTVNEYRDRPVLPTPLQVIGAPPPATAGEQPRSAPTAAAIPAVPQPPQTHIPAIGDIITGQRSGPIREPLRGVKVELNKKWYQAPSGTNVIGIIRTEDAAGQVSGGFSGEVIERHNQPKTIYLILKPKKAEKST